MSVRQIVVNPATAAATFVSTDIVVCDVNNVQIIGRSAGLMTIGELMDRVKAVMKKHDLSRDAAVVVVMCEIHAEADAKNVSQN